MHIVVGKKHIFMLIFMPSSENGFFLVKVGIRLLVLWKCLSELTSVQIRTEAFCFAVY